jgi:hypothetical protein
MFSFPFLFRLGGPFNKSFTQDGWGGICTVTPVSVAFLGGSTTAAPTLTFSMGFMEA